jgi:uroporphyrinogen decarboxylase
MDPSRLFSPKNELIKLTKEMLNEFGNQKYIANLGHGILPNTPVDNVKVFVDTIKSFSND